MALLLDTCAIIYLANDLPMERRSRSILSRATSRGEILVSPISAWEIGLLATKRRTQFLPDAKTWFGDFVASRAITIAPLTSETLIDSWSLPGPFHNDPADRIIIATARALVASIVTRDERILDYAAKGHVQAVVC
jgi:PIN domain nuclease of toxin-antitoxin system